MTFSKASIQVLLAVIPSSARTGWIAKFSSEYDAASYIGTFKREERITLSHYSTGKNIENICRSKELRASANGTGGSGVYFTSLATHGPDNNDRIKMNRDEILRNNYGIATKDNIPDSRKHDADYKIEVDFPVDEYGALNGHANHVLWDGNLWNEFLKWYNAPQNEFLQWYNAPQNGQLHESMLQDAQLPTCALPEMRRFIIAQVSTKGYREEFAGHQMETVLAKLIRGEYERLLTDEEYEEYKRFLEQGIPERKIKVKIAAANSEKCAQTLMRTFRQEKLLETPPGRISYIATSASDSLKGPVLRINPAQKLTSTSKINRIINARRTLQKLLHGTSDVWMVTLNRREFLDLNLFRFRVYRCKSSGEQVKIGEWFPAPNGHEHAQQKAEFLRPHGWRWEKLNEADTKQRWVLRRRGRKEVNERNQRKKHFRERVENMDDDGLIWL